MNNIQKFRHKEYNANRGLIKQTGVLFSSQMLVLMFGILIKMIQTRTLTPAEYGLYAFFGTVTGFSVLFFRFGFFTSIKVLLANNDNEQKEKELFGLGFIIALVIGLSYSLTLWGMSFYVDALFNVHMNAILKLVAPLCFILPFRFLINDLAVGSNKIKSFAFFDVYSKLFFLITLMMLFYYDKLNVIVIILLNLLSVIIAVLIILRMFKPSFSNLRERLTEVFKKNKEYGLHYYSGAIVNQTTYKFDEIFITYFVNLSQLGFYSLAGVICSPMTMLSQSFSDSIFKKLASKQNIPSKVFIYNTIWLIFCVIFLYFFSTLIVKLLFGNEYSVVGSYIALLSLAYFFQGLYAPFSFLSAKSKGKEIRNVALIEAVINVAGNLALIPFMGVIGAIIASIMARFVHFIALWYYYQKYLKAIR